MRCVSSFQERVDPRLVVGRIHAVAAAEAFAVRVQAKRGDRHDDVAVAPEGSGST